MAADDAQTMWEIADADVDPVSGAGPALDALTNIAALLYRAQLAGNGAALEKIIADASGPAQTWSGPSPRA